MDSEGVGLRVSLWVTGGSSTGRNSQSEFAQGSWMRCFSATSMSLVCELDTLKVPLGLGDEVIVVGNQAAPQSVSLPHAPPRALGCQSGRTSRQGGSASACLSGCKDDRELSGSPGCRSLASHSDYSHDLRPLRAVIHSIRHRASAVHSLVMKCAEWGSA